MHHLSKGLLYVLGSWPFIVWGVFVRLVAVYHCIWLVTSATHRWGHRSYPSGDRSTNCWWVALLTYGEGWHNNHHTFQTSARHGFRWWEPLWRGCGKRPPPCPFNLYVNRLGLNTAPCRREHMKELSHYAAACLCSCFVVEQPIGIPCRGPPSG